MTASLCLACLRHLSPMRAHWRTELHGCARISRAFTRTRTHASRTGRGQTRLRGGRSIPAVMDMPDEKASGPLAGAGALSSTSSPFTMRTISHYYPRYRVPAVFSGNTLYPCHRVGWGEWEESMEQKEDPQRQRFLVELEFVQCLANPHYIEWLATQVASRARGESAPSAKVARAGGRPESLRPLPAGP